MRFYDKMSQFTHSFLAKYHDLNALLGIFFTYIFRHFFRIPGTKTFSACLAFGVPLNIIFISRGQLSSYKFDRVLNTLWTEFEGFRPAFYKFALDKYSKISYHMHLPSYFRASQESSALAKNFKQPTPQSITKKEVMNFKLRDEFETLRSNCPLLYHVVCGALELGEDQLEVITEKLHITENLFLRNQVSHCLVGLGPR